MFRALLRELAEVVFRAFVRDLAQPEVVGGAFPRNLAKAEVLVQRVRQAGFVRRRSKQPVKGEQKARVSASRDPLHFFELCNPLVRSPPIVFA